MNKLSIMLVVIGFLAGGILSSVDEASARRTSKRRVRRPRRGSKGAGVKPVEVSGRQATLHEKVRQGITKVLQMSNPVFTREKLGFKAEAAISLGGPDLAKLSEQIGAYGKVEGFRPGRGASIIIHTHPQGPVPSSRDIATSLGLGIPVMVVAKYGHRVRVSLVLPSRRRRVRATSLEKKITKTYKKKYEKKAMTAAGREIGELEDPMSRKLVTRADKELITLKHAWEAYHKVVASILRRYRARYFVATSSSGADTSVLTAP